MYKSNKGPLHEVPNLSQTTNITLILVGFIIIRKDTHINDFDIKYYPFNSFHVKMTKHERLLSGHVKVASHFYSSRCFDLYEMGMLPHWGVNKQQYGVSTAKQEDNAIGNVCLSVCCLFEYPSSQARRNITNSMDFVCVFVMRKLTQCGSTLLKMFTPLL